MSRAETTSTAAGASSAFSKVREVVTVRGLSAKSCAAMTADTVLDCPATAACDSMTTVLQPGDVNRIEYVPGATPSISYAPPGPVVARAMTVLAASTTSTSTAASGVPVSSSVTVPTIRAWAQAAPGIAPNPITTARNRLPNLALRPTPTPSPFIVNALLPVPSRWPTPRPPSPIASQTSTARSARRTR